MTKIFQAMAAILKDVDAVSKSRASSGSFSFKYRGIDDVMNALHSAFAEHKVFLLPKILEHDYEKVVGPDGKPKGYHHLAKFEFTFYAEDGSSVTGIATGECIANDDKGVGKCASYALKICLLQTFMIPTEEQDKDPDSISEHVFEEEAKTEAAGSFKVKTKFGGSK